MIIKISGEIVPPESAVSGQHPVRDFFIDFLGQKLGGWLAEHLQILLDLVNSNSVEIILFFVIACSFGLMIAPIFGANTSKWFGRLVGVLLVGTVWRMLI